MPCEKEKKAGLERQERMGEVPSSSTKGVSVCLLRAEMCSVKVVELPCLVKYQRDKRGEPSKRKYKRKLAQASLANPRHLCSEWQG